MNDRTISLIGENNLKKIEETSVLLVGLGGVGGTTFEALVRSGFKNLTIIDYDTFDESNLNRQILSSINDLGNKKTDVADKLAKSINPAININVIDIFLNKDNIDVLNKYEYDFIIDAIDTIDTKVLLIKYAKEKNIKIISCMGTGKRLDPSKLHITKLNKTFNDALAKIMRQKLRKENIKLNIPAIFSEEDPIDTGKIIGSMIMVPSTAGLLIVSYILKELEIF